MSSSQWQPVGIELPPGWKAELNRRAAEFGVPMRYLHMLAIDRLLAESDETLGPSLLAVELASRRDFETLCDTPPGQCGPVWRESAERLAEALKGAAA